MKRTLATIVCLTATAVLAPPAAASAHHGVYQLPQRWSFDVPAGLRDTEGDPGPQQEQRDAADIVNLAADSKRNEDLLLFEIKVVDFPATAPGTAGIHSEIRAYFVTTGPQGGNPLRGGVGYDTYHDAFYSLAQTGADSDFTDCPGELVHLNSETNRVVLGISKDCFPGTNRRVARFYATAYSFIYTSDGNKTDQIAADFTKFRQSSPIRLRPLP